jgi:lambda repressor-like predicted transcriptional regulator
MVTNWSKVRIINELRERGTTAAALAAAEGLSRSTLYSAMERPYPRIHELIAAALGQRRQDIWPLFYDAEGRRLSRRAAAELRASTRTAA